MQEAEEQELNSVGTSVQRRDGLGHVKGQTDFVDDLNFQDLLHLKVVRSPVNHAEINNIDFSEAEKVPGYVDKLTAEDVPNNYYFILELIEGYEGADEPLIADKKALYKGEPLAAVIAETPEAANEAAAMVEVDLTELEAVFDPEEAVADDAPILKPWIGENYFDYPSGMKRKVRFGDVEKGFEEADYIIEGRGDTSPIEHAPTETTSATAKPEPNGRYKVFTNSQALHFSLNITHMVTQLPTHKLQMVGGTVGGGFGGKVDVIVEPMATVGAMKTGRPVRYKFNREEELQISSPRGAWRLYYKDGVTEDGDLVAREMTVYGDSGAYNRHSPYAGTKVLSQLAGPYYIPNCKFDSILAYTNKQPSSAMRGFAVTGPSFANEVQMTKIAEEIGMDPMEFRMKNARRRGQQWPHRTEAQDASAVEVMQEAAKLAGIELSDELQQMSSFEEVGQ